MKIGTENRKQLILAGTLGILAVGALVYTLGGGPSDTAAPPSTPAPPAARSGPSPVATKATVTAQDPVLHPDAMLAAESLVYTGAGRNIFSMTSTPLVSTALPKAIAGARVQPATYAPAQNGPAPEPPIGITFFGTATSPDGHRRAFLLKGDDVFVASDGDVVSRRFRVGTIAANSVEITDLASNRSEHLPLVAR